jgi:secondary thiamine-phosphate synthase enzyme
MHTISINIETDRKDVFVDITADVERALAKAHATTGICTIFCPHTTAGLTINEHADPSVAHDVISFLSDAVPGHRHYTHLEGNSPAHIKAAFMGPSLQVIVEEGKPLLGTWQGIFLCEFDGPRTRKVWLTFTPNDPAAE